jgi:large subunit ribosomal protein L4
MKLKLHGAGGRGAALELSDNAFGQAFNGPLVHQVVTAYLARRRSGSKAQKSRSTARGGGTKPWRQKGTGRARAGTIRSPIWVGGGRAFAAQPRDYSQKVNKKMYRAAMRSVLSELVRQERLVLAKSFELGEPRTKLMVERLKKFDVDDVLIVIDKFDENVFLAARNLPKVSVLEASAVDPVNLIRHENVLMTVDAIKRVEETLG